MTLWRSESTWVPVTTSRRRLTAADIAAVLTGVFAALGVLAFMGALLTSGVAGLDIFEASKLERLAASTVATAIVLVFAAFFSGGWAYGALRGREKRGRLGDLRFGEPDVLDPARWVGAGTRRSTTMGDSTSMKWEGRWHQLIGTAKQLWGNLTDDDLDVGYGRFDELVSRIKVKTGETEKAIRDHLE